MADPGVDPIAAAQAALRQGRHGDAIAALNGAGPAAADVPHHWLMAQAQRMAGDADGEIAALHAVVKQRPSESAALFAMGDAFARTGDERAATAWFRRALATVTPQTPAALQPMIDQARRYCEASQRHFTEHLEAEIARADVMHAASPALGAAIDLLFGRRQLFLQQPTMFYFPGLPQREFYEREEFGWVAGMEAEAPALRDEFLAIVEQADSFVPYVERLNSRPAPFNPLLEDPAWGAAYLWKGGEATPLSAAAPQTMAALAETGQPVIHSRSPMALYSRLKPGAHIIPHHGLLNTRLICHLPLVTPDGCALRVGSEIRPWRFGEMLIFDDSVEHEAWNRGVADRTVLLFEIWRPEIGADDRIALTRLFEAIDRVDPALMQDADG